MSDVKAAAERLRRVTDSESKMDVYPYQSDTSLVRRGHAEMAYYRDLELVAAAYLAGHPADDCEPITKEWLRGALPVTRKFTVNDLESYLINSQFYIECYLGRRWLACVSLCITVKLSTRGDVRRLAAALGVALKE